jgi:hypothetical protein
MQKIALAARRSKVGREDTDVETTAALDDAGQSIEELLGQAYKDGTLKITPAQVKELLAELFKFDPGLTAENLRNTCASMSA